MTEGLDAQIKKATDNHDDEIAEVMKKVKGLLKSGASDAIVKYSPDQPRDERGRFAESGGAKSNNYDASKIIGKTTLTGTKINDVSNHALQRMKLREISADTVVKTLTDAKSKVIDGRTYDTKVCANRNIRVVVNEIKGNIVTCIDKEK
ncbi:MAG: DUF4258 domain-containing protein [Clostridia bacterium]|nr:DUF4258 domain-containing protein [Clostridia bacterium]